MKQKILLGIALLCLLSLGGFTIYGLFRTGSGLSKSNSHKADLLVMVSTLKVCWRVRQVRTRWSGYHFEDKHGNLINVVNPIIIELKTKAEFEKYRKRWGLPECM